MGATRMQMLILRLELGRGGLILYRIEVNSSQIFNNATLYFGDRVHDTATVRPPVPYRGTETLGTVH